MKVRSSLAAGGLAAVLVLASCGGDDGSTKVGQVGGSPTTATRPPADSFKVGEVVKVGDTEVVVHGVQDPFDAGEQKPAAGSRFVSLDAEVKNVSSSPQVFSSFGQFELQDSSGKSYDPIVLRSKPPLVAGPAAPGESRRGVLAFEVPEGSQGLLLVFKDRLAEKGEAKITLS